MNVASKELCEELFKLSGWDDKNLDAWGWEAIDLQGSGVEVGNKIPAYNLGYLLDKLVEVKTGLTLYHVHSTMSWEAFYAGKFFEYGTDTQHWETQGGMNPADAVCRLAIQMFKEGKLTK